MRSEKHDINLTAQALIELIKALIAELHPAQTLANPVHLDSALGRELGFDSLARVELFTRVESQFQTSLPDQAFSEVETPRDLLRAILRAQSHTTAASPIISNLDMGEGEVAPDSAETLIEVLYWHANKHPQRPHAQFYSDDDSTEVMTYQDLLSGAKIIAAGLQQLGLEHGQSVAIMLPTSTDYFYSFFGILLAGGIPVPIYPPVRRSQLEDHLRRQFNILDNCQSVILITVPEAKLVAQLLKSHVEPLHSVVTPDELRAHQGEFIPVRIEPEDIAFLQYTSGSTGSPKGVILTHANLLANIRADGRAVKANPEDVFISWLPLYHDMGLIGAWFGSLYFSVLLIIMSPLIFLRRPQRWLWAIHNYKGTLSAAPNFAYELCLSKIQDEDIQGLDLSSWRVAFNGAESVSPKTINGFCERFKPFGFKRTSMFPVYGLAENTVGLAFPELYKGPVIDRIQRQALMLSNLAIPADETTQASLEFVSSGHALPGHQIRIVDAMGHELPERQQGRLQFSGLSATSGYYRNPEKTRILFQDNWLESGDLAYMVGNDIFITGRVKDIIILGGRNIYPEELEQNIGNINDIRKGRVAVFGSHDEDKGTERLVVMAETRATDEQLLSQLQDKIRAAVTDIIGAPPDDIVLAPPGTVLKTSSGKIRRTASRDLYEKGIVGKAERAVWRQIGNLVLTSLGPEIKRILHSLRATLYSAYAWSMFIVLGLLDWLLVILTPVYAWRWRVPMFFAKAFARLTATPFTVKGLENLPQKNQNCIYVVNHASYLDGYLLAGALPRPFSFVAKKELSDNWFMRIYLRRIKTVFVDRFDRQQSLSDTQQAVSAAKAGQSLLFFPEGTFQRMSGLLPFRMGAFLIASETGLPVIPIAVRGSRLILRPDSWFVHHGSLSVVIGKPIHTDKNLDNWQNALKLRNECREHILRYCGEPDLPDEQPELLFNGESE